jgi:2-polyprenyl-3-methyl-5-hydroxy-6-metoxy-1,4-benzoquinol methylase
MLKAHLDPNTDAASRRPEIIVKSVKWLSQYLRLSPGSEVIDLGCGPGLYCAHFHREGWKVTGLDFSERSIAYAREQAAKCGQDIEYFFPIPSTIRIRRLIWTSTLL